MVVDSIFLIVIGIVKNIIVETTLTDKLIHYSFFVELFIVNLFFMNI
jgi:hypothetical protein